MIINYFSTSNGFRRTIEKIYSMEINDINEYDV